MSTAEWGLRGVFRTLGDWNRGDGSGPSETLANVPKVQHSREERHNCCVDVTKRGRSQALAAVRAGGRSVDLPARADTFFGRRSAGGGNGVETGTGSCDAQGLFLWQRRRRAEARRTGEAVPVCRLRDHPRRPHDGPRALGSGAAAAGLGRPTGAFLDRTPAIDRLALSWPVRPSVRTPLVR